MFNGLHYNSISTWLKERFGCKVVKLSLDAGLTCPNRDGTKGTGGCSFCTGDGSGSFAGTIEEQLAKVPGKWTGGGKEGSELKYLAYFQSFTNTYAPAEKLRALWDAALSQPGVVGLAVATRPDCLGPDVLELLSEFNRKTFLWVELGLQTSCEKTASDFNRCWKNIDFEKASTDLSTLGIKRVTHLILGLPGEDKRQMLASAEYAMGFDPFGVKIHALHLMKGTRMGQEYLSSPFPVMSMEEYICTVCDIIEMLPPEVTIHRLTGDAPSELLIAPEWTRNKHRVLNGIQKEFAARGTYQGFNLQKNMV